MYIKIHKSTVKVAEKTCMTFLYRGLYSKNNISKNKKSIQIWTLNPGSFHNFQWFLYFAKIQLQDMVESNIRSMAF